MKGVEPTSDALEVVFGKDGGQVSGTVRADSQLPGFLAELFGRMLSALQLTSSAQVVLVPAQRDRHDLYKFAITDASGQFKFLSVPPGSYKVFAWENVEQFSWFDPTVLARYEPQGMPATISASSNVTVDLRVIPAAGAR